MNDLKTVFDKLKKIGNFETNILLAKELKIEYKDFRNLKYTNKFNAKANKIIINYADKNNISLDWIFLDKDYKEELTAKYKSQLLKEELKILQIRKDKKIKRYFELKKGLEKELNQNNGIIEKYDIQDIENLGFEIVDLQEEEKNLIEQIVEQMEVEKYEEELELEEAIEAHKEKLKLELQDLKEQDL